MSGGTFVAQARAYVESTELPLLAKPFAREELVRALAAIEQDRSDPA